MLALKLEPLIKERAKANQKLADGGDRKKSHVQGLEKSPKVEHSINTREEVAKIAGVSDNTIRKVKTIVNEETPIKGIISNATPRFGASGKGVREILIPFEESATLRHQPPSNCG